MGLTKSKRRKEATLLTMIYTILSILVSLVVLFVSFLILKVFVQPRYKYAVTDQIPGPEKHWLKGTMHHTKRGPQNLIDSMNFSRKYGGMVRFWRGPFFPVVAIYHAEQAKEILKNSHPKGIAYDFLGSWLGTGLLTSFGQNWQRKRKLLTPAFHFKILMRYTPIFYEETLTLVQKWEKDAEEGNVVDITKDITLCTLDIIGKCAFGVEIGAQHTTKSPFVKAIYDATDLLYSRAFKPWLYADAIYYKTGEGKEYKQAIDEIHSFADSVIASRRIALEQQDILDEVNQTEKKDFLDI